MSANVILNLNEDEALVLFEWLVSEVSKRGTIVPEGSVEEFVFWSLEGQLEKILVEPFKPDYMKLVEAARARITAMSKG